MMTTMACREFSEIVAEKVRECGGEVVEIDVGKYIIDVRFDDNPEGAKCFQDWLTEILGAEEIKLSS